jgi:hypothetical protein
MTEAPPIISRRAACGMAALAGVATAAWLFFLSGWLGVVPGKPLAERRDVLFNADAGQRIADAKTGTGSFGYGSHPLVHLLWPRLLSRVVALAPDRDGAAVVLTRVVVACICGAGVGVLAGCLVTVGVRRATLAATAPIAWLATSNAVACLPDHFGLSLGVLAASFGLFLREWERRDVRGPSAGLLVLGVLASGVCLSNGAFPFGLWTLLRVRKQKPKWTLREDVFLFGVVVFVFAAVVAALPYAPDDVPVLWQAKFWLHRRVVTDPADALTLAATGPLVTVVGPAPLTHRENYFRVPMVTYETESGRTRRWPYDAVGSVAALAWLGLVATAAGRAVRRPETRRPALVLIGWIGWNALFHNTWGDEYFLYSPHYAWAIVALVPLGLRDVSVRKWLPVVAVVAVGQARAFVAIRDAVAALPS